MSEATPLDQAKHDLFAAMATIGQAFASPQRLQILGLLAHAPRTVEQLAAMTAQSNASASAHLKVLRSAGLVVTTKIGRHRQCQLASPSVASSWLALRRLSAERRPEARERIRQFFSDPDSLSPLSASELHTELQAGRVRVVDLRPPEEFRSGRIPGALSLPYAEIETRASELPDDGSTLAYCRGPYCLMALRGVEKLRALGHPVRRLNFSIPEWREAGLALEQEDPPGAPAIPN